MARSWIGVDVSKLTFVAARRTSEGFVSQQFGMNAQGFAEFFAWLPSTNEVAIAMESSGPYWRPLACWLESLDRSIPYAVVNARRVRRFAEASEERSKDDWIDAEVITHFAETFEPPLEAHKSSVYTELRAMWRHHLSLVVMRQQLRDQLEKSLADPQTPKHLTESIERLIEQFGTEMRALERACLERLKLDSAVHRIYRLLLSIPSIGPKTALTLITEYGPRLSLASSRQLTSYAGLDVIRFQSGTSVSHPPHISKQGNWRLRRALYLAALTAITHNPRILAFYQRKVQTGINGKAALIAASRKLIELVAGVLRTQKDFDPNHQPA